MGPGKSRNGWRGTRAPWLGWPSGLRPWQLSRPPRGDRRHQRSFLFLVLSAGILLSTSVQRASAVPVQAKSTIITGASPFANNECTANTNYVSSETEPMIASDPSNPQKLVATWTQDDELSNVTAVSHDGGRTWATATVPGITRCTGNPTYDRAYNPMVSFGADGTAYMVSLVEDEAVVQEGGYGVMVNRWPRDGQGWSEPVLLRYGGQSPAVIVDFPRVAAHPAVPGAAYVTWSEVDGGNHVGALSRTFDGGLNWSPPLLLPLLPSAPGRIPFFDHPVVLPDGSLVNVYEEFTFDPTLQRPVGPTGIFAVRSDNGGLTWSGPVQVAEIPPTVITDPDSGVPLADGFSYQNVSVSAGPGGSVYVAWYEIDTQSPLSRIEFSRSVDGGRTWSATTSTVTAQRTQAFSPTITVRPDGTIGVTYFDFRNDEVGDEEISTDLWFRHSHDAGATWSETPVSGSFDLRRTPRIRPWPLGAYFGLTVTAKGFAAVWPETNAPAGSSGPTDLHFAHVH